MADNEQGDDKTKKESVDKPKEKSAEKDKVKSSPPDLKSTAAKLLDKAKARVRTTRNSQESLGDVYPHVPEPHSSNPHDVTVVAEVHNDGSQKKSSSHKSAKDSSVKPQRKSKDSKSRSDKKSSDRNHHRDNPAVRSADDVIETFQSPTNYKIPVNHPQQVDLSALIAGLGSTLGDTLRTSIQETMESSVDRLSNCVQEVLASSRNEEDMDYGSDSGSSGQESDDDYAYSSRSNSPSPMRGRSRDSSRSHRSRHRSPSLVRCGDALRNQVQAVPGPAQDNNQDQADASAARNLLARRTINSDAITNPINGDIAQLVNDYLRPQQSYEVSQTQQNKDRLNGILRPANLGGAVTPRLNEEIWNAVSKPIRSTDERMQRTQTAMLKGASAVSRIISAVCNKIDNPDYELHLPELVEEADDALFAIGMANVELAQRRKEQLRGSMHFKYKCLTYSKEPFGDWLMGDDLTQRIKDINTASSVSHKVKYGQHRRFGNKKYFHNRQSNSSHGRYDRNRQNKFRGGKVNKKYNRGFNRHQSNRGKSRRNNTSKVPIKFLDFKSKVPIYDINFRVQDLSIHCSRTFLKTRDVDLLHCLLLNDEQVMRRHGLLIRSDAQAGRLSDFLPVWKRLTSDFEILDTISGLHIDFVDFFCDQKTLPTQIPMNQTQVKAVDGEIEKLLNMGVLVQDFVDEKDQFFSTIFTRPKKDGGLRMILNLKKLNESVEYVKFKMDTLTTALTLVTPHCWMASLDLRHAYYSVGMAEKHWKYLKFMWQGKRYKFTCLPNGYSAGPRKFTKILKPVLALLRCHGYTMLPYIDDTFITSISHDHCMESVDRAANLLENVGFEVHAEKSVFEPTTRIVFLGYVIDSALMIVALDEHKSASVKKMFKQALSKKYLSLRELAQIIGKIISLLPASKWGRLHYRALEMLKIRELKKQKINLFVQDYDYSQTCILTCDARDDIGWWIENVQSVFNYIVPPNPDIEIRTDASGFAWGAYCSGVYANGHFSEKEMPLSINTKETLAIKYGLFSFEKELTGKNVLVRTDNMTALAYVKNQGGTKSDLRNKIAKQIWFWCQKNDIWLSIAHIPGIENVEADSASRNLNERTEWSLNQAVFDILNEEFGPLDIDLFASRLNKKLPIYVSWQPDPYAMYIDAFSLNWSEFNSMFLFPPFRLIGRCLQKLWTELQQGSLAVMVAPLWTTQPWWSLLARFQHTIVMLPSRPAPVKLPWDPVQDHPLQSLQLLAVSLSKTMYSHQKCSKLTRSEKLSQPPGAPKHANITIVHSGNGSDFVTKRGLTPLPLL